MAAPAILFFVVTCIAGIRGGNNGGNYLIRGSSADEGEGDSKNSDNISTGDDELSLEYHHGHHKKSGRPQDNAEADSSFDFYAYSMSYQPEFCKENNEKFVGCQNPNESWQGQLTIHGLWPNVSFFNSASYYIQLLAAIFSQHLLPGHNIIIFSFPARHMIFSCNIFYINKIPLER